MENQSPYTPYRNEGEEYNSEEEQQDRADTPKKPNIQEEQQLIAPKPKPQVRINDDNDDEGRSIST